MAGDVVRKAIDEVVKSIIDFGNELNGVQFNLFLRGIDDAIRALQHGRIPDKIEYSETGPEPVLANG